ncbi:MAG: hypothetical protein A2W61_07310 [Deltaproteobacteria bacterium RIFCSPLOWO2_01_44_7]|nr:MAG: hypothetical protein A2712_07965 [Deltaproteobacteria bacterium RIFCSPHIGHO2_01_FULL_43_49]OGQ14726.1 MAG: hypothetical protein A3D22_09035 [Deltaproteobacteria bacterium RIFCSPHIGHO2_02_FULL_44_53]OGQ28112.1 MAG: hypothetical protein A3D98_07745 [Deltaproteobacteria bacterium RIFCSPHIGHO2_12_FULL_44_21]OGQ31324.1 MAG: hypothetical protein A2979_07795 [Deltaproteobacteria bacterium RIFCSPLOWO2_01_FULL_45_74]OGQ40797.1 MAG: hypothetical protein A2W61_07310 [Deltaproteobacteria bacterium 
MDGRKVQKVLDTAARRCAEVEWKRNPDVTGKVKLELSISDEKVENSTAILETGNIPPNVLGCIERSSKTFTFPGLFRENLVFTSVISHSSVEEAKDPNKRYFSPQEISATLEKSAKFYSCAKKGDATVQFEIQPDGRVLEAELTESHGLSLVQRACVITAAQVFRFSPFEESETKGHTHIFRFETHRFEDLRHSKRRGSVDTYLKLANSFILKQNYPEAITALHMALEIDPKNAMAYRSLGVVHSRMGETKKAMEAYRRYLELAPDSKEAPYIKQMLQEHGKTSPRKK